MHMLALSQYMKNILESLVPESLTALTRTSEEVPLLSLCSSALVSLLFAALPFQCLLAGMFYGSKILPDVISLFFHECNLFLVSDLFDTKSRKHVEFSVQI